jgi:hypothetical protein
MILSSHKIISYHLIKFVFFAFLLMTILQLFLMFFVQIMMDFVKV